MKKKNKVITGIISSIIAGAIILLYNHFIDKKQEPQVANTQNFRPTFNPTINVYSNTTDTKKIKASNVIPNSFKRSNNSNEINPTQGITTKKEIGKQEPSKDLGARNAVTINGNNNDVAFDGGTINKGIKQRHVDQKLLNEIAAKIPDRNTIIEFMFPKDAEGENFAFELQRILRDKGYTRFNNNYFSGPTGYNTVEINTLSEDVKNGKASIIVNPASNISQ